MEQHSTSTTERRMLIAPLLDTVIPPTWETAERLSAYLTECGRTAYAEPRSDLHTALAKQAWMRVQQQVVLRPGGLIVDLGCGSGFCLEMFRESGLIPVGVTNLREEVSAESKSVLAADIHDIGLLQVDGVWCRHAAEHSPAPGFLLAQIGLALQDGGWLYLEVPGPGTSSLHEANPNHHAVMGGLMWAQLILRASFRIIDHFSFDFSTQLGADTYFGFIAIKETHGFSCGSVNKGREAHTNASQSPDV